MFDKCNPRYSTIGIQREVPLNLQLLLWSLIDDLNSIDIDYLQVFELFIVKDNYGTMQKITHRQEQPDYNMNYLLYYNEAIRVKIYVIDVITHAIMLLTEEY